MKKVIRKGLYLKNRCRYLRNANKPIKDNLVMFISFMGIKYADSPKAIYEYMLNCSDYDDYEFVWFFRHPENYQFLNDNPRTKVIKYNSDEHYKYYATAKYWVVNSRIPDVIDRREGQIYLQCWHGTPLKRLGMDIEVKGTNAKYTSEELVEKYVNDSRKYSYMTSPSAFCSEKFISAFGLNLIGHEDIIIEEGYPRNDDLINFSKEDASRIKKYFGIPEDKKVILYAPTWRDNQYNANDGYTFKEEVDFSRLREKLGDKYVILFRAHYFVANKFDFNKYEGFIYNASSYDEINDLYIISDLLITDYSSVFFDYAILKRPIIFYMYDLDYYRDDVRGFYISLDELPGTIIQEEKELAEQIIKCENWEPDEKYIKFNETYNYLDDGKACERVARKVFQQ